MSCRPLLQAAQVRTLSRHQVESVVQHGRLLHIRPSTEVLEMLMLSHALHLLVLSLDGMHLVHHVLIGESWIRVGIAYWHHHRAQVEDLVQLVAAGTRSVLPSRQVSDGVGEHSLRQVLLSVDLLQLILSLSNALPLALLDPLATVLDDNWHLLDVLLDRATSLDRRQFVPWLLFLFWSSTDVGLAFDALRRLVVAVLSAFVAHNRHILSRALPLDINVLHGLLLLNL